MKKNIKKLSVMLLLLLVAIGSYFIAGTYAKYTRAFTGADTATVAKFSVSASGLGKEQTTDINLFKTIKEANTTSEEANVLAGKIAPGTGGQFTTSLTNASEVDVKAVVTLEEENEKNVPVEYSLDGQTWKKATELEENIDLDYSGKANGKQTEDVTVYWRWSFDNDDSIDTTLGESETSPTVKTTVKVTFTQKD